MRSKVIFGHPKWPLAAILWKKIKTNKSCVLIWNGEKCHRKWFSVIQNGRRQPFCEQNKKNDYCSEMARNAIESDFRSSKMAAGSHFMKKKKLRIDLKWREMRSKFIFGHPKWGGGGTSQWPACKPFGNIHSICPCANTPIVVGGGGGWHTSGIWDIGG